MADNVEFKVGNTVCYIYIYTLYNYNGFKYVGYIIWVKKTFVIYFTIICNNWNNKRWIVYGYLASKMIHLYIYIFVQCMYWTKRPQQQYKFSIKIMTFNDIVVLLNKVGMYTGKRIIIFILCGCNKFKLTLYLLRMFTIEFCHLEAYLLLYFLYYMMLSYVDYGHFGLLHLLSFNP